jgi:glucose-6-phosphate 1-epimerase
VAAGVVLVALHKAAMSDLDWVHLRLGDVATQGAHVTRWTPHNEDALFLSPRTKLEKGTPIRGGIPVVFPWFGEDKERRGPSHGFARRVPWTVLSSGAAISNGDEAVLLELCDSDATRAQWPHRFRATMDLVFGAELAIAFSVENRGAEPFSFEALLHTYLRVGDVKQCSLDGLEDAWCYDKTQGNALVRNGTGPMRFDGECDRTFCGSEAACVLTDPVLRRTLTVLKEGARSTVVWTPGASRAAALPDLGDSWPQFLCVESGNVMDDAITLQPGERHVMRVRIECATD